MTLKYTAATVRSVLVIASPTLLLASLISLLSFVTFKINFSLLVASEKGPK
jgi:hypothetical protein